MGYVVVKITPLTHLNKSYPYVILKITSLLFEEMIRGRYVRKIIGGYAQKNPPLHIYTKINHLHLQKIIKANHDKKTHIKLS